MSTDRELLVLAAKAAGYTLSEHGRTDGAFVVLTNADGDYIWNPRTDDGDSRRLAVKLEIRASVSGTKAIADWWRRPAMTELDCEVVAIDGDPCDALRLAVLRAAAEIGKAMP